ncbi:hypothetical protein, partial [Polaribacter sp.]|uniref:hypothetical protein n=1 Tax=Polaribacter sp. TaxID=1920175 RepID=UPI004048E0B4
MNKKTLGNNVYKKLLFLALPKVVASLPTSEFPPEIPRCQNRNFSYTNKLATIMKNLLLIILILNFGLTFSQNI